MPELTRRQQIRLGIILAVIAVIGSAIGSLAQTWLGSALEAPQLREQVARLNKELTKKSEEIAARNAELQLVETRFAPFKTIAIEKFSGSESERVAKLALLLNDLQTGFQTLAKNQSETSAKAEDLALRLAPRRLSASQRESFRRGVFNSRKGSVAADHIGSDNEAARFAAEIAEMLRDCGYMMEPGRTFLATGSVPPLAIEVQSLQSPSEHGPAIQRAFLNLGIAIL